MRWKRFAGAIEHPFLNAAGWVGQINFEPDGLCCYALKAAFIHMIGWLPCLNQLALGIFGKDATHGAEELVIAGLAGHDA